MSKEKKIQLSEIMRMAWQFVKRNGFTKSEALKTAWLNANARLCKLYLVVQGRGAL